MQHFRTAWILPVVAIAAASVAVSGGFRRAEANSVALAQARRQNLELLGLRDENRRLESAQLSADEREQLEARHAEADALRARLATLQKDAAQPEAETEPDKVQASDWVNAGRETPRAAIVSVLWAASRGDVDQLSNLLGFSPDVRTQADAMFSKLPQASQQEYGSPEKVVATLLAGSFPKDALAVTVNADKQWGQDAAIAMSVEHSDGQENTNVYRFRHLSGGWQLMVPASVLTGYEKTLLGDQQPAETGAP